MTSVITWTYSVKLRSKNAAGTVQHTFTPLANAAFHVRVGPPTYEPEQDERTTWDRKERPAVRGYRARLEVEFQAPGYAGIPHDTASSGATLATVLTDLVTAGNYLEVSIDGGTTWKRCNLDGTVEQTNLKGLNVGTALRLQFRGADLQSTVPVPGTAAW